MELQQRTGKGGHIPVDDGLVSSAPNDAYGALGGGETWSGVPQCSMLMIILRHVSHAS